MSTPREQLHALVDELPDDAVAELLSKARLLELRLATGAERSAAASARLPAWVGSFDGPTDLSERASEFGGWPPDWFGAAPGSGPGVARRADEILRAEFGRRR